VRRVLLDSNVLISAAIRPAGPPGRIVKAFVARRAFDLVLSPGVVAEVETAFGLRKLRRYLGDPAEARRWLADLVALADLAADDGRAAGICRDPEDDAVLGAAACGRAQGIVTGDDDLLALGTYEGIPILSPRAFIDRVLAAPSPSRRRPPPG